MQKLELSCATKNNDGPQLKNQVKRGRKFGRYLSPILDKRVVCKPQIVAGNLLGNVMRNMHTNVMAQYLHPIENRNKYCQHKVN